MFRFYAKKRPGYAASIMFTWNFILSSSRFYDVCYVTSFHPAPCSTMAQNSFANPADMAKILRREKFFNKISSSTTAKTCFTISMHEVTWRGKKGEEKLCIKHKDKVLSFFDSNSKWVNIPSGEIFTCYSVTDEKGAGKDERKVFSYRVSERFSSVCKRRRLLMNIHNGNENIMIWLTYKAGGKKG